MLHVSHQVLRLNATYGPKELLNQGDESMKVARLLQRSHVSHQVLRLDATYSLN